MDLIAIVLGLQFLPFMVNLSGASVIFGAKMRRIGLANLIC